MRMPSLQIEFIAIIKLYNKFILQEKMYNKIYDIKFLITLRKLNIFFKQNYESNLRII